MNRQQLIEIQDYAKGYKDGFIKGREQALKLLIEREQISLRPIIIHTNNNETVKEIMRKANG
jgi:hypothetical protein